MLFLALYSVTLNAAERRVDAGTAALLINTGPILIAVLGGLVLGEGFPRGLYPGIGVAFCGCVVIGVATSRSAPRAGLGVALCLAAAVAYALAVVVQKPVLRRVAPLQVAWLGCAIATVTLLPFAPALAREAATAPAGALAWTVYLGAVPTALGFAGYAYALRRTSAGRMAALAYLIPVVAVLLGWALLGETPSAAVAAGGGLCLAGVALARTGGISRPARRSPPGGARPRG